MIVLITGANGFLGEKIIKNLLIAGTKVIAVKKKINSTPKIKHKNLKWISCDLSKKKLNLHTFKNFDLVIHLAGIIHSLSYTPKDYLLNNELSLINTIESVKNKTKKFIFTSSQNIFGNPNNCSVDEEFDKKPSFSQYSCSKINCENWLEYYSNKLNLNIISLRLTGFIDAESSIFKYLISQVKKESPVDLFKSGKITRDYLHSDDLINLLFLIMEKKFTGYHYFNIGSGQRLSSKDLAKIIYGQKKVTLKINNIKAKPIMDSFVFSIKKAKKVLRFKPNTLENSIIKLLNKKANE